MPKIFLVIPPGLEKTAAEETIKYPFLTKKNQFSNEKLDFPEIECTWQSVLQANVDLRIPNRILVRIDQFRATNFPELVKKASRLNWQDFLTLKTKIQIRTTCKKSKLYHSDAVTERIHRSIQNKLAGAVELVKSKNDDDNSSIQLIIVRIVNDVVEISIDSSGEDLHRRGYRLATGKAPLRENLASAMILASGWDVTKPLIDPFCGSGTIPIEAAMIQNQIAPGSNREFICEKWPILLHYVEKRNINPVQSTPLKLTPPNIFGSDRDAGAIQFAQDNSNRAGVQTSIIWSQNAVSDMHRDDIPGWIVTNPPYGQRISSNQDLRNLYAQFGNILARDFKGWKVIFLSSDPHLAGHTQLGAQPILSFLNGGIKVAAYFATI